MKDYGFVTNGLIGLVVLTAIGIFTLIANAAGVPPWLIAVSGIIFASFSFLGFYQNRKMKKERAAAEKLAAALNDDFKQYKKFSIPSGLRLVAPYLGDKEQGSILFFSDVKGWFIQLRCLETGDKQFVVGMKLGEVTTDFPPGARVEAGMWAERMRARFLERLPENGG